MANWRDEVLLEGEFILLPKKKGLHKVTLTRGGLYFNPVINSSNTFEEKSVYISDIIGCHLLEPRSNGLQATSSIESDNSSSRNRRTSRGTNDLNTSFETISAKNIGFSKPSDPSVSGFVIFAYPFRKKVFSGKKVRHRVVVGFSSPPSNDDYEERRRTAEKWTNVLNCLARDIHINISDISSIVPPPRGKFLVLINPHSGPGKAHSIFKNEVAPMLKEANIPYKDIITEYAGHASDLLKDATLSEWQGIVIVSGDGLIFETVNGLMSRADWASSIRVPIGCLPGGSGNALCCSLNYSAGEPLDSNMAMHSTFVLIKHRVVPMDLVMVHIPDKTVYSFLSIAWGITADIDFESEKYRSLGEARFTVGAIRRILGLRKYRGKLSFLPVAEYVPKETPGSKKKVLSKVRRFSLRSHSSSKSTISSSETNSPKLLNRRSLGFDQSNHNLALGSASSTEGFQDDVMTISADKKQLEKAFENGNIGLPDLETDNSHDAPKTVTPILEGNVSPVSAISDDTQGTVTPALDNSVKHLDQDLPQSNSLPSASPGGSSSLKNSHQNSHGFAPQTPKGPSEDERKRSSSCASPTSRSGFTVMAETQEIVVEEEMYQGRKQDFEPVPSTLLPPLDEPVPDNWVSVEDDFVLVCGVYQTHLGSEMLAAPDAHLNDGFIHLMFVREGISRNALLNLFLSFGEGSQVYSPHVEIVKVLALRIEPESNHGNLMIDGERFDPTACQAQVLPGLARIMAIK